MITFLKTFFIGIFNACFDRINNFLLTKQVFIYFMQQLSQDNPKFIEQMILNSVKDQNYQLFKQLIGGNCDGFELDKNHSGKWSGVIKSVKPVLVVTKN